MNGFIVKVSELRPEITKEDIQELFSRYGEPEVGDFKLEGQIRTVGVLLKDEDTAIRAVRDLEGTRLKGQLFRIDIDRGRGPKQPPPPTPSPPPKPIV